MAQFTCEHCGTGFEQKSAYERHLLTSHPRRAPSAADMEKALRGAAFPLSANELVKIAKDRDEQSVLPLLRSLPDREYRDAAEVARALGEIKSHRPKPADQPSKKGGSRAMRSLSAARITALFKGMEFPASAADLRRHAQQHASDRELERIERFRDLQYRDMSDVAREFGRVTRNSDD